MSKVARLPVQHPQSPHCASCGADLPNLDGAVFAPMLALFGASIVSVSFRIRCACGLEWDLRKTVKS